MPTKKEMFLYLEDLRKAGGVQYLYAHSHLMNAFDLPPQRADEVLKEWQKEFSARTKRKLSVLIALALVFAGSWLARANGPQFSANPYAPDSTSNPYGRYGSPYAPESVNNPYGQGVRITAPANQQAAPTINPWTAPGSPAHSHDWSGLSTLGAPGSGLRFKTEAKPEDVDRRNQSLKEMMALQNDPELASKPDIFETLTEIRKQEAAK